MKDLKIINPSELISKFWKETHYWKDENINNWSPEQIFNYSPTGELIKFCQWYEEAQIYYGMIKCSYCDSYEIKQVAFDFDTMEKIYKCGNHKVTEKRF